ncbi:unnamed protein product [Phaedon cochleariae]|uniref:C2H2-type domain-containing protein n=1 Tax=Phaedon cochleariae TaxID=80249 RepID=A0A9N9SIZ6_PHACE|nr:unnamed protein product [Phaedon cochleariae]
MSNICRLCLQKEESIMKDNIFDLHLTDTFYWIYGVEVEVADPFPKSICRRCQNITNFIVRIRKQFQTNQFILKEKRCPPDYNVDESSITKDVGTCTDNNYSTDRSNRILISYDTLAELSQPFVKVRKLEDTDIRKEYQRISKYGFRKRKTFQKRQGSSILNGEPGQDCRAQNKFNKMLTPSVVPPSMKNSFERRVEVKTEPTDKLVNVATNTNANSPNVETRKRPVLISRATNTNSKNNAAADATCDDVTLVSANIFEQLFSPVINIKRLEDSNLSGNYEKVNETTYRLIPPQLELQGQDEDETKRLSYMDYYYKLPTSALKELIIERHNEFSGDQNSIAINNCKEKAVSLFKMNTDVPQLEVCGQCNQAFKTKDLLNIHRHLRHRNSKTTIKPITKPRRRRPRLTYKSKKSKNKQIQPKNEQHQTVTVAEPTTNSKIGSLRPKITDLFSSLEHSKFSHKQLWLDETLSEDQWIANNRKNEHSTPSEPQPKTLQAAAITDEISQDAGEKNSLRFVRRLDPKINNLNNAKKESTKESPNGTRQLPFLKSYLIEDIPENKPSEIPKYNLPRYSNPTKYSAVKKSAQPSTSKCSPATIKFANKQIPSISNNSPGNSAEASASNSNKNKILMTNRGVKYTVSILKPGNKSPTPPPVIDGPIFGMEPSTSKAIRKTTSGFTKNGGPTSNSKENWQLERITVEPPKLSSVSTSTPSTSSVQQEIVWFPEIMEDSRELRNEMESDEVIVVSSDEESSSDSNGRNYLRTLREKLTSALSSPMNPVEDTMDDSATVFIAQRFSDLKQTRTQLETMRNIQTALYREIETGVVMDARYDKIMNLLAK